MEDVKIKHQTSFEMGLIAKEVIYNKYKYILDDDEVSYLAMYFSMALDRLKYVTKPKNILVVCGLGVCSSRILVYKIRQQYGNYIQDIVTCQFHELRKISLDSFDCILSTVDKPIGTNQPVIYITDFISTLNEEALDQFFLKDEYIGFDVHQYIKEDAFFYVESISSVEEAIDEILNHLPSSYSIPLELKESILKREALSSTSFSNACAIPHPIQMLTEESFCAVLVLNKPMRWGEKWVRFVFLLSPSKYHPEDLRRFNDHLAKLFLNAKKLETFANDPTYLTLKKLLVEG